MKIINNEIQLNKYYVFNDLVLNLRNSHSDTMTNRKMKPWLSPRIFIEASIQLLDPNFHATSYKAVEHHVCDSVCLHRYDNYKSNNVKQCYVHKGSILSMHRKTNKDLLENKNPKFYVESGNYTLRLTLHGDINQLNMQGQQLLLALCENAHTVLGYSTDVTKLYTNEFSRYIVQSAMNNEHVAKALLLDYNFYYSGLAATNDIPKNVKAIQCKISIDSRGGCSTCKTPCGSSDYNIIAVSEKQKTSNSKLAIKQGRKQSKGNVSYFYLIDLAVLGLMILRGYHFAVFCIYLVMSYGIDLLDFVLGLLK